MAALASCGVCKKTDITCWSRAGLRSIWLLNEWGRSVIEVVMFVLLGAAMGTLGGLFGIGGGLVAIPALGVLFGLDQQLAQGTALLMVLPNVLLALWRYNQRNRILLRNALMLIIPSFIFAWLTSMLAVRIDPQSMRLGFVAFLVILTVFNVAQMYWRNTLASGGLRHE
ncbi:Membrane protein, partial [Pseudomonas syringae pv. maculicola]